MTGQRMVIGWRERVDLPSWGVRRLLAKADTGARSSAVHAEEIQRLPDDRVGFWVVFSRVHPEHRVWVDAPIARTTQVRSSSGHQHERIFVRTPLRAGPIEREIEVGLVSRELMECRMLIGRIALGEDVLVDPSRKYLLTRPPRQGRSQEGRTRRA